MAIYGAMNGDCIYYPTNQMCGSQNIPVMIPPAPVPLQHTPGPIPILPTGPSPLQSTPRIPIPLEQNTVDDIANWVYQLACSKSWGNEHYLSNLFRKNEIDGIKIAQLDNENLKNTMQIQKLGHRLVIIKEVKSAALGYVQQWDSGAFLTGSDLGSQCSNWEYTRRSASVSNQGSQLSNWEGKISDGGGRDTPGVNMKFRKCAVRRHEKYPVHSSRSFSDGYSPKCKPRNYQRSRRHFRGRPGPKAGRNQRERDAGRRYQEKKSFRSRRRSPPTNSFTLGTRAVGNSREEMRWVSPATGDIYQRDTESTSLPPPRTEQDDEKLVLAGMRKSRKSEIAPAAERKQNDCEPLTASSDDGTSIPRASSLSCSSRGNTKRICPSQRPSDVKLLLTYQESEERWTDIADLHKRFRNFGYEVQIKSVYEKPQYEIWFPDAQSAEEAYEKRAQLGYNLEKLNVEQDKPRTHRPSPKHPSTFKVICPTAVTTGKKLKSKFVRNLEEGEVVLVNQLKKRRARIIRSNVEDPEVIGWVSTHSEEGKQLLVAWNEETCIADGQQNDEATLELSNNS